MIYPSAKNLAPLTIARSVFTRLDQLPNARGWYRSSEGVFKTDGTPATNLQSVRQWRDITGRAMHGVQDTGAQQPILKTAQIDGLPALHFDTMNLQLPAPMAGLAEGTAFVVCKCDLDPQPVDGSKTGPPIGNFGSDDSADHYPYLDGIVYHDFGSTVRKTLGDPAPSLAVWHLLEMTSAAGAWQAWINGTSIFGPVANVVAWGAVPQIGFASSIGGAFYWFTGDVAEVFLVGSISAYDRGRARSYFKARYPSIAIP